MTLPLPARSGTPRSRPVLRARAKPRSRAVAQLLTLALLGASFVGLTAASPAIALSGDTRMHDTTAIKVGDCYWAYSTGFERDAANPTGAVTMHTTCSEDGATGWTSMGPVWDSVPTWITEKFNGVTPPNYWAPDINYIDGQYHLYYAASLWQNNQIAYTGLLTADRPGGPWTDQGLVVDQNYPIDPEVAFAQDGSAYLAWGSWGGTYMRLLDQSTGKLSSADTTQHRIANGIENPAILFHEGYYYLFGSKGSCCRGVDSTYFTVVGRSESITGPYLDSAGTAMTAGGGDRILSGTATKVAAGGGDWFADDGGYAFIYHYYDRDAAGRETGDIRPFTFVDGWPVIGAPIGTIVSTEMPAVTGRPLVGSALSATPGGWTVEDAEVTYAWLRDGTPIAGATAQDYALVAADAGTSVGVAVTAAKTGYDTGTVTTTGVLVRERLPYGEALQRARDLLLSDYTQGSAELFTRELDAVEVAAQEPGANLEAQTDRLEDAYLLLVADDILLVKQPVLREWVRANTDGWGNPNNNSAADNGWKMFDGDLTTFTNTRQANGYVTVAPTDGSSITTDRIRTYPRTDGGLYWRLNGHEYQGSNDGGATWETFATITDAVDAQWSTIDLPAQVSYQQVRLVDNHGGWTNASEVEFWVMSVDTTLVDLLLGDAASLAEADWTADSWTALVGARDAAAALDDPTQAEADRAAGGLREAIAGLVAVEPPPVDQELEAPGKAGLKVVGRPDGMRTGSFAIEMDLRGGTNGSTFLLYENRTLIGTYPLELATPGAQQLVVPVTNRPAGRYVYTGELVNSQGSTATSAATIVVRRR